MERLLILETKDFKLPFKHMLLCFPYPDAVSGAIRQDLNCIG